MPDPSAVDAIEQKLSRRDDLLQRPQSGDTTALVELIEEGADNAVAGVDVRLPANAPSDYRGAKLTHEHVATNSRAVLQAALYDNYGQQDSFRTAGIVNLVLASLKDAGFTVSQEG